VFIDSITQTFISTRLTLTGFSGPLITHGIDILSDPSDPSLLHIFVINELPNPLHYVSPSNTNPSEKKWRVQIEIFTHTLGSSTATHQRSIQHPLINLPNDIYAISPTSIYATNDHHYSEGSMRILEDLLEQHTAPWSNTVRIDVSSIPHSAAAAADQGVNVTYALTGIHNNNGLGHGPGTRPDEILVVDASGGVLHRAQRNTDDDSIKLVEAIQLDSSLDNPSWFEDVRAPSAPGDAGEDKGAYYLAGLAKAAELPKYTQPGTVVPSLVWRVKPRKRILGTGQRVGEWRKELVFQDDGGVLRSASAAVVVEVEPGREGGEGRQGWLFVTGFLSEAMVAVRIDL